jgi:hypothetical protein
VADWFAQLNNKMGGDLKKIQIVGQYMIEIWKAVGMERIGDKVNTGCNAATFCDCAPASPPLVGPRVDFMGAECL